jgi:hypothetical protein
MPLFEFTCPICLNKIERLVMGKIKNDPPTCQQCNQGQIMEKVEFSVPARRDPRYGEQ